MTRKFQANAQVNTVSKMPEFIHTVNYSHDLWQVPSSLCASVPSLKWG